MCGEISRSQNSEQAVEYGLAYAESYQGSGATDDADSRRKWAKEFIEDYVPSDQRVMAIHLLAQRADDNLTSNLDYFGDVVW